MVIDKADERNRCLADQGGRFHQGVEFGLWCAVKYVERFQCRQAGRFLGVYGGGWHGVHFKGSRRLDSNTVRFTNGQRPYQVLNV
jgi:hypothetical protein